jgi:hypothetical protein
MSEGKTGIIKPMPMTSKKTVTKIKRKLAWAADIKTT